MTKESLEKQGWVIAADGRMSRYGMDSFPTYNSLGNLSKDVAIYYFRDGSFHCELEKK